MHLPFFASDNPTLSRAARIATGDIVGNILPYKDGLLEEEEPCCMAGLDYHEPWTRDAAINTMNALCFFDRETVRNTLLAVCSKGPDGDCIGGQYWDKIIWAPAAWQYFLVTRDMSFLAFACRTVLNTLSRLEEDEWDADTGLFCGPAVYGDGVAAYPDRYADTPDCPSGIMSWPALHPSQRREKGYGIPMQTLSTNCVYYAAYTAAAAMLDLLGQDAAPCLEKAGCLKRAIHRVLWDSGRGTYDYFTDPWGRCSAQEALGLAFSILTGVADPGQCESIAEHAYVSGHGIPCVYPSFPRYTEKSGFGRHSGTIWPHAQGFWALAMIRCGHKQAFEKELFSLSEKACRDKHFSEIYHPLTGLPYGGLQEGGTDGTILWYPCEKQTWSATAYWSMIFYGLFGISITRDTLTLRPFLPENCSHMELKNISIIHAQIHVTVNRGTQGPCSACLPAGSLSSPGSHDIHLWVP